jgi:hypothetical protein
MHAQGIGHGSLGGIGPILLHQLNVVEIQAAVKPG